MLAFGTVSGAVFPLRSIFAGIAVFALRALPDLWLQQNGRSLSAALMADVLVGLAAGVVVFFCEWQERRNMIRRLEVIRLMNHHVRNSLQVISAANSALQRGELATKVEEAVERIEWTLREVLPGLRSDLNKLVFDLHTKQLAAEKSKVA
jgi:4-amino-4-deoxy-L-arabinose transferase-like glycosyltransferase